MSKVIGAAIISIGFASSAFGQTDLNVVKTCDPIVPGASGSMTVKCHLVVTGDNFASIENLRLGDFFAAVPPATPPAIQGDAGLSGTMENGTNFAWSEPWTCIEQTNAGETNRAICSFSGADLIAASGTSTVTMSFQLDVQNDPAQAVNCAQDFLTGTSQVTAASGQRGPSSGNANLPDNCVFIDPPVGSDPVIALSKNCAIGIASSANDETTTDASCVQTRIKPVTIPIDPPKEVFLKNSCEEPVAATHNGVHGVAWSCEITAVALPAPFAGAVTFTEDATGVTGSNNASIIGIHSASNSWSCSSALPTQQSDCTISGAAFNPTGFETVVFDLFAETHDDKPVEWKSCVGGVHTLNGVKREINGNCEDMTWKPTGGRNPETTFDVTKTCRSSGPRQQFSSTVWFEPYECSIRVTTNGAPFTNPIMVTDALTIGAYSASSQVQNITSADPWQCVQPPFALVGQGNQPECLITSADFPHHIGSSTLTVNMVMHSSAATLGAENCANLSTVDVATGQLTPITSDCATIFDPAPSIAPTLDVVKTCEMATRNAVGIWEVDCTVTVTGQNLPAGEVIRVMDELNSAGSNNAQSGTISPNNSTNSQCGGGLTNNGFTSGCNIYVDDLVANGGTIVFDYSGTINGPGGFFMGQGSGQTSGSPQNCAYADIASAGIHGPTNATGKSCVDIPLLLSAIPHNPVGPVIPGPGTPPPLPGTAGEVNQCSTDVLFVVDQSSSMNQHGRLAKTRLAIQQAMNVFQGNGSAASLVTFSDQGQIVIAPAEVIPSGNMLSAVLGLSGNGATNWADGLAKARMVVTAATKKPLVLFITDGGPNRPLGPDQWGLPPIEVAAIRAQGSRVIGIGLNRSFIQSALVDVFGPNVVNVGNGDIVSPLVNDGIIIPNDVDYADVFGQIALAYCPTAALLKSQGTIIDLKLPEQPYLGDDEPIEEATEVLTPTPELDLAKEATGPCVANRDTQKYDCGFRLTVTNIGNTHHTGPVAISDNFGTPSPSSVTTTSSGGWTCDKPRGGGMACINRNLDLQPGQSSTIDMSLKIPGLRDGGRFQNCAEIGVGRNRAQRVALVQEMMNQRGLNAGPVDGQPGRNTYAALAQLQEQLGLPQSREFDDALFTALGISFGTQQPKSCAVVDLPVMPAPPLSCDKASTYAQENACVCRYDNMYQRDATSCGCQGGYNLVTGRGCVEQLDPVIQYDPPKPRCENGLPRINGRCVSIQVNPTNNDAAGADGCRIKVGGICLK